MSGTLTQLGTLKSRKGIMSGGYLIPSSVLG